jgi:glycosyltransferase involved in cell wall biosynthesis
MKILLVCAAFPPRGKGGGPAGSYMIARALLAQGHTVRVVTVGDAAGVEEYQGVTVHVMRSPNIYWNYLQTHRSSWRKLVWHLLENFNPLAYLRLRPHLRELQPDVVMTVSIENTNVATWLLARHHKVPVVHVIQSYFLACWRGSLFKNGQDCVGQCTSCKLLSLGKKPMSQLVNGVFGETRFVLQEHLALGYFRDALKAVIPGPIVPIPGRQPRRRDGALVVGYMGVLAPHKGLDVLADAAALLAASGQFRFLVGGTGESPDYVAQLQRRFGAADVTFLGWVRPDETYPLFDVLVVPSRWKEPFGRIVVEAMAYGIPVVCARSGGVAESVDDQVNGFTFASGDHLELAHILRDLVEPDEPRRLEMGRQALRHADDFALERIGQRLDEFVQRTVSAYQRP